MNIKLIKKQMLKGILPCRRIYNYILIGNIHGKGCNGLRLLRRICFGIIDAVLINFAAVFALYLRFELRLPTSYLSEYAKVSPVFTVVSIAIFATLGLYSVILRYASIDHLLTSAAGAVLSTAVLWGILRYSAASKYPRSVLIITGVLEFICLAGLRISVRLFDRVQKRFSKVFNYSDDHALKVLIVGAGDAGAILGRELLKPSVPNYKLIGYVDDDLLKKNTKVNRVKVYGNRYLIPKLVDELGIDEVIIAMPSVAPKVIKDIVKLCQSTEAKVKALPKLLDMTGKPFDISMVKDIDIEDLLSRPEVNLDIEKIRDYIYDKDILVTGAGGSIGTEICRQIAGFQPKSLILLGHGENSIFEANLTLDFEFPKLRKFLVVADVRDQIRIKDVFSKYRPQVVFHAAAHKHVPLMESNVQEAIKTNVFGTLNVSRAALHYEVEKLVMISTDKAVNPTSVMGASKRVAELVVLFMNALTEGTQFVSVRFGNVLDSRGSVVPIFRRQIAKGGPVTITHPKMCRYFMTKKEAVELVLQASTMGRGGEIFVLDMGEPVSILEMAEQMIRLSGREPYSEIPILFTGVRPGEKLFEEILTTKEFASATHHTQIFVAKQQPMDVESFRLKLAKLEELVYPKDLVLSGFDDKITQTAVSEICAGSNEFAASGHSGNSSIWAYDKNELLVMSRNSVILRLLKELVPEFSCKNSR